MDPTDAPAGGDKPASGAAPDIAALDKLISDKVRDAVHARISRTEEKLANIVATEIAKIGSAKSEEKKPDPAQSEDKTKVAKEEAEHRLSLKALQEQIANLNKGIEQERQARARAEQQAVETMKRSEVVAQFAKYLGAESPHLAPYVNHYLTSFEVRDGKVVRKVLGEYDQEQYLAAEKAVEDLFKGDLKHLVQTSKAAQMPPAGFSQVRGQPYVPPQQQRPATTGLNPLEADLIEAVAMSGRPELAQALHQHAMSQQANGTTPQK